MRFRRRALIPLVAVATAVAATMVIPTAVSADDTADVKTFSAIGTVGLEDVQPATPMKEGFTLTDAQLPPQAESARQPDGSVPIYVRPDTKYYLYDPNTQTSKASTYDELVQTGTEMKVGGQVASVGGATQLTARWVWVPVPAPGTKVPNPQPSAPRDYTFQRTFNVVGTVLQTGAWLPGSNLVYSDSLGFVGGLFTFTNNAHVTQIVGAHKGKLNLNTTPATTYYKQDPNTGKYTKTNVTKADVITVGAEVRVVGKYGWVGNDWRFIVNSVWSPPKTVSRGAIGWTTALSGDGTTYDGFNVGDGEVSPGSTELVVTSWSPQSSGVWNVTGTWTAGDSNNKGTVSGTFDGTWDPTTGDFDAMVVVTDGTGREAGLTGSGTFEGSSPAASSSNPQPPSSLTLTVKLAVERTTA